MDPAEPLHIFDLPRARGSPALVLETFLRLLQPPRARNFEAPVADESPSVLAERGISEDMAQQTTLWMTGRYGRCVELKAVPALAAPLRRNPEYNAWLTQIVALHDGEVQHLALRRLAENCGRTAQPEFLRTIDIPGLRELILKEPSLTADNLGLKTWGSAYMLSKRLVQHPNLLVLPVLELGSGTGLVGMVSASLGHETTLTDLPEILPNLRENVELNSVAARVEALDWSNPKGLDERFETVIFSDPLYSLKHPQWIADMVKRFLSETGCVLLQLPMRPKFEAERETLWGLLEKYTLEEEHYETGNDDFGSTEFVFRRYR